MTKILLKFAAATVLLSTFAAYAETHSSKAGLLSDIYSHTGLEQQFLYLGKTFTDSGLEMGRASLPPGQLTESRASELFSSLQNRYNLQRLKQRAWQILEQELDKNILEDILPLVQEPVWQKAVKLENKAYNPAKMEELEQYVGVQLQERPPRQERIQLAYQLAEKTGAIDLTINLITFAALNNARLILNNAGQLPYEVESSIRSEMDTLRPEYENLVVRQLLYTYRFMSDSQFEKYVEYFDNPSIQALNSAITLAMMAAFK